jgi:hypothetical protein
MREKVMTVQEIIAAYQIPKYTVAALADVSPQDLATYLRSGPISGGRRVRIERAASDLKMIFERLQAMGDETGIYLTIRTKDVDSIRKFIEWVKQNPEPAEQSAQ